MVIPLTTSQNLPPVPFHISYIFQNKLTKILPEQMRVADKSRIRGKCLGRIPPKVIEKVEKAINLVLGMKLS